MDLMRFPASLYLRLFGAAGLGYIVGSIGKEPTYMALAIACGSFGATLVGWLMMRPLMREATKAIKKADRINQGTEEKMTILIRLSIIAITTMAAVFVAVIYLNPKSLERLF
jgi:hypothetical protein